MTTTALLGGAFDPPHLGHLQMARYLLDQGLVDQVRLLPVKQHPFGKKVSADHHRLAMLERLVEPGLVIEPYELHQAGVNYSADTLFALAQAEPGVTFSWLMGSDNVAQLHRWGGPIQHALETFDFWVYPRSSMPLDAAMEQLHSHQWLPAHAKLHVLSQAPTVTVSSSQVRERLKDQPDANISDLVSQSVIEYINDQGLYVVGHESTEGALQ